MINITIKILCLFIIITSGSLCFAQDTTEARNKPRVIFKNSENTVTDTVSESAVYPDSLSKPRIKFNKALLLNDNRIQMISEDKFSFKGQESPVGSDGELLKKAMGENFEAIKLVDKAYSKKTTGALLMGIGGAVVIASLALQSTWVKTHEEQRGNMTYTSYWIPGITVGVIIGGVGYVQFSSLKRGLFEAVDFFNGK